MMLVWIILCTVGVLPWCGQVTARHERSVNTASFTMEPREHGDTKVLGQSTVQNVAERSYARQSSVYVEWDGMLPVDMGVPRAVDGSGRTCMQTNRDAFPWIGLDLGKEYQVSYIDINFNEYTHYYMTDWRDCKGYEVNNGLVSGSVADCRSACDNRRDCKAFTYNKDKRSCSMKYVGNCRQDGTVNQVYYTKSNVQKLRDFDVSLGNGKDKESNSLCISYHGNEKNSLRLRCNEPLKGRYLFLKSRYFKHILSLCEIRVYVCRAGNFGYTCAKQCNCLNDAVCDKATGACPSGCNPNYTEPDCQTMLPVLSQAPVKSEARARYIHIAWQQWSEMEDVGNRPIAFYKLQMRRAYPADSPWNFYGRTISHNGNLVASIMVENLDVDTEYYFRVITFRQEPSGPVAGPPSPVGGPFKTTCADPSEPVINTLKTNIVDSTNKAKIIVTWQKPKVLNCKSIKEYHVKFRTKDGSSWDHMVVRDDGPPILEKDITGLKPGTEYQVMVEVYNNGDLFSQSEPMKITTEPGAGTAIGTVGIAVGVIVILVIVSVVVSIVLIRKRRTQKQKENEAAAGKPVTPDQPIRLSILPEDPPTILPESESREGEDEEYKMPEETTPMIPPSEPARVIPVDETKDTHRPIKLDEMEVYIKKNKENKYEGFKKQYSEIPLGLVQNCDIGKKTDNKHKNRFVNIIAYDHSRVVLEPFPEDPYSDYINACYIHGYKNKFAYIASQGANKYTVGDIWRMIWQKNISRIVMVTNLVENGKRKCEQYWPDEGSAGYGDIRVQLVDTEKLSEFTIRTLSVTKVGEETTKILRQFHFTAWPDHGVPNQSTSLINFRRKVRSFDSSMPGQTMIHCSAGVGRTGTYIALDSLLEQARNEDEVDILHFVYEMREQRVNMIQTLEQYVFTHDALLEAIRCGQTVITCTELKETYDQLNHLDPATGKTGLMKEYGLLQEVTSVEDYMENCKSALAPENVNKNRYSDVLPSNRCRPYLMTPVEVGNDYINAVFVDSYTKRDGYLLTQMPLSNTVLDFWRLLYDHKSCAVVMLNEVDENDESCAVYWPDENSEEKYGPFTVEHVSTETTDNGVTVRQFKLAHNNRPNQEPRSVKQFQVNCWANDSNLPSSKVAMIEVVDLVERWQARTGNGPATIHCMDGASCSGLYCALSIVIERIKVEQEVDVFQTSKQIRINRPQAIEGINQYDFCYQVALEYIESFQTYANFK